MKSVTINFMNLLRHLKQSLSLDYRSLALYRMLLGLVIMADVLYRLPDLVNFYTDIGLVSRTIFMSEMSMPWSLSFHFANGSTVFAAIMFGIHFLFGVMLLTGYKTRWATIGAYIFTVSIHNRNWLVNNGGDDILRAVLFISIFLPLNKCFSVDSALRRPREEIKAEHFSTWGLTFFLQVFVIYFVSYILKDHDIWRKDFTAVFYASRLDIFATPIGVFLRDYPFIQKLTTIYTAYLEWGGPILLVAAGILGKRWWIARTLVVAMFWGLHIGIIFTMWIGVFPYLCLAIWTAFLPGPLWDKILGHYRSKGMGKLTIHYDQDCGLCQKVVLILREFFLLPEVLIRPAQEDPRVLALMEKNNSWVTENAQGAHFFHFRGMLEVFKHSPLLRIFVPFCSLRPIAALAHRGHVWISHHRSLMGALTQFLEYTTPKKTIGPLFWSLQALGVFFFVTILMWNLTTIKKWNIQAPFFQQIIRVFHLYQEWNMFAPYPKMDNIWVEIPAHLEDGSQIELLSSERDVFSLKDKVFPENIPNEHWRKFYLNLSDRTDYARYYGGFLCRQWNDRMIRKVKDQTLRKFEIIVYSRPNFPDGSRGEISKKLTWRHWCYDSDMKEDKVIEDPLPLKAQ
jgi:hypothetical protein